MLLFTSAPLDAPLCLGGVAQLTLRVWATSRSVDLVARLCRVDTHGASYNLTEALVRVEALPDEPSIGEAPGLYGTAAGDGRLVTLDITPLAVDLLAGECLRLHICSAAHPRWMRNLCAAPEVPLHEQTPPKPEDDHCVVRVGMDDAMCRLTLPVVES